MTAPNEQDQIETRTEKGSALTIAEMDANLTALAAAAFHVGFTTDWYGDIGDIPAGWVACDGAAYSRTATYDRLYAVLGVSYGGGDGSTTFNVPDVRGRFPRYWDGGSGVDPDAATRTARADAAASTTDAGTTQGDATDLIGHEHYSMTTTSNPDSAGNVSSTLTLTAHQKGGGFDNGAANRGFNITPTISPTGAPTSTDTETRPTNIATILIMRAF